MLTVSGHCKKRKKAAFFLKVAFFRLSSENSPYNKRYGNEFSRYTEHCLLE
jgi:hypothetical protein